jgi:hypothetical protein
MPDKIANLTVSELAERLDSLKELTLRMFEEQSKLSAERDRRYEDRFKAQETAVAAALLAQKESTGNAFAASEKAIVKAEDAQRDYNVRSNEFRGQLDDQAKLLMSRAEAFTKFDGIELRFEEFKKRNDAELASLREFRSETGGEKAERIAGKNQTNVIVGLLVTIVLFALGALITFLAKK